MKAPLHSSCEVSRCIFRTFKVVDTDFNCRSSRWWFSFTWSRDLEQRHPVQEQPPTDGDQQDLKEPGEQEAHQSRQVCGCESQHSFDLSVWRSQSWLPLLTPTLDSHFWLPQASKKKVYMLYNLQPDRSVTGGAWYSDQDFESEFVEVLNQQCFKFLQSKVLLTHTRAHTALLLLTSLTLMVH